MKINIQINYPKRIQKDWGTSATWDFNIREKDRMTARQIVEALKLELPDQIPDPGDCSVWYKAIRVHGDDVPLDFMHKDDTLVITYR